MNWTDLFDLLSMRGWGLYVWGSYGVSAALMLIEAGLVRRQLRLARGHPRPGPATARSPLPEVQVRGDGSAKP